jgi:hypothetical protein
LIGQIIVFDIPAVADFVQNGDMLLDIHLHGSTTWTDDIIATATMSVWRYLSNPFRLYSETIPLKPLSKRPVSNWARRRRATPVLQLTAPAACFVALPHVITQARQG